MKKKILYVYGENMEKKREILFKIKYKLNCEFLKKKILNGNYINIKFLLIEAKIYLNVKLIQTLKNDKRINQNTKSDFFITSTRSLIIC